MGEISRLPEILPLEPTDGAPESERESIFLSTPTLSSAADFCIHYQQANSKERKTNLSEAAEEFLKSPAKLISFLDALSFLKETQARETFYDINPDTPQTNAAHPQVYQSAEVAAALTTQLEHVSLKEIPLTPELAYQWLLILTESDLYAPIAEIVLTRYSERCTTTKNTIDFLYNLFLVVGQTSNQKIIRKILEIRTFATKIITSDSRNGSNYLLAQWDTNDDTLRRALEIDSLCGFLLREKAPDLSAHLKAIEELIMTRDQTFIPKMQAIKDSDPRRFSRLREFHQAVGDTPGDLIAYQSEDTIANKFPYNLIKQAGPLREMLNEMMARDKRAGGENIQALFFPNNEGVVKFRKDETVSSYIRQCLTEVRAEHAPLNELKYWKTLSLLVPEELEINDQNGEQKKQLADINERLRDQMKKNSRYLLNPRGDLIEITDEQLLTLGFESILYEMAAANKQETIVTVTVCGHGYRTRLDTNFFLRETDKPKELLLPPEGAFITAIILSHLHEIRCSEKVNEVGGKKNGKTGNGQREKNTTRRAHLRRLQEGETPRRDAIERAWIDYGINLGHINETARQHGDSQMFTFVREVDNVSIGENGPLRSQAPDATKNLQIFLHPAAARP